METAASQNGLSPEHGVLGKLEGPVPNSFEMLPIRKQTAAGPFKSFYGVASLSGVSQNEESPKLVFLF